MGNCLAYFLSDQHDHDDTSPLGAISQSSSSSGNNSASTAENSSRTSRDDRRLNRTTASSSYVNELYVNATERDTSAELQLAGINDAKRARVLGLLEQIPADIYNEGGKGDIECAICMVEFEDGDRIRYLPCLHSYHVSCIDDWLLRSFTCPSCLEPVDSAILSSFTTQSDVNLASLSCSPATHGSKESA
uniref:RING-type domain-containing protein n=1 Tax=Steinernema glaseri TaxID=37863 RepID=A0A1I8A3B4_9BILA